MKSTLTEEQWNSFVNDYCLDNEMKKISYQELMNNTNNGQIDLKNLTLPSIQEKKLTLGADSCPLAIGYVVVDVVCLVLGAVSIRSSISASSVEDIAGIVEPEIPQILKNVETIAEEGSTSLEKAKAVWGIIKVVLKSPYSILKAVFSSLPWYKKALVIAQAIATIAAALLTDGAALIAEIVVELATFGFLVSDAVSAVSTCSTSQTS